MAGSAPAGKLEKSEGALAPARSPRCRNVPLVQVHCRTLLAAVKRKGADHPTGLRCCCSGSARKVAESKGSVKKRARSN